MRTCGAALLLASMLSAPAAAQRPDGVCERDDGMPMGPVQTSLREGELGLARRVCPRSEVALGAGGLATIRPEEFYGHARAAALLSGSWTFSAEGELFAALEVLRYETVISSIEASDLGVGAMSAGATHQLAGGPDWRAALSGRLALLGTFRAYEHAWPIGLDLGAGIDARVADGAFLHGRVGGLGELALGDAAPEPRAGALVTAGFAYRPWRWFAAVLDGEASFGYAALLDVLSLSPALRFGVGPRLGFELGGLFPIAGRERALAAASLRAAWRFE